MSKTIITMFSISYAVDETHLVVCRHFIDRLISQGGRVGDFTIIPRQRFDGLEIRRT